MLTTALEQSLRLACTDRAQALRSEFQDAGRLQIRNALDPASAEAIYRCLSTQRKWNLVYTNGRRHVDSDAVAVAQWPLAKRRKLEKAIHSAALDGFQYYYANIPIYDIYHQKQLPGNFLNQIVEFLNDSEFLDFARLITDDESIEWLSTNRCSPPPSR